MLIDTSTTRKGYNGKRLYWFGAIVIAISFSIWNRKQLDLVVQNNEYYYEQQNQQQQQQQRQQQQQQQQTSIGAGPENGIWLVQIGANDGETGNDRLVRRLLSINTTNAILVEPNPQVYELLLKNIERIYPGRIGTTIYPINALVCDPLSVTDGVVTFFTVNNTKLLHDYPDAPHWVKYQLSSIDYESIERGVAFFLKKKKIRNDDRSVLVKSYIAPVPTPCMSFQSILEKVGFVIDDTNNDNDKILVDVLVTDTEGYDDEVVQSALAITKPRVLVFEQKSLTPDKLNQAMTALYTKEYKTDCDKTYHTMNKCQQPDVTAYYMMDKVVTKILEMSK